MPPSASRAPWGFIPGLVTVIGVVAAAVVGFGLLALIPSSGWSLGDGLDDQMCVTTSVDSASLDEAEFSKASSTGVRAMPTKTMHCKPYDSFDRPLAARVLAQVGNTAIAIAVLILALMLRRIVKQTRDEGPFHPDTTRHLNRFRWVVAGVVGAALIVEWVVRGVELQLLTDEPWPGSTFVRTTALVLLGAVLAAWLCEFGVRQRQEAWQQGFDAARPDDDGPV